jgi:hypothetical protein
MFMLRGVGCCYATRTLPHLLTLPGNNLVRLRDKQIGAVLGIISNKTYPHSLHTQHFEIPKRAIDVRVCSVVLKG